MIEKNTRVLYMRWLRKVQKLKKKSADNYGTYISNCDSNVNVFCADGNLRRDLVDYLYEIRYFRETISRDRVKTTTKIKDAVAALKGLEGFIDWLLELPGIKTFDEIARRIDGWGGGLNVVKIDLPRRHPKKDIEIGEIDSYSLFFHHFKDKPLTPCEFYKFGIENSVFADCVTGIKRVEEQFEDLISILKDGPAAQRHLKRKADLFIRRYSDSDGKSQWMLEVYNRVFPRVKIGIDKNSVPKANICDITKCQLFSKSHKFHRINDRTLLINYQCSHVMDDRTKNPILFEAAWNVVLTPKMLDPLTGHETLGCWPRDFQRIFHLEIQRRFRSCINRFNAFAEEWRPMLEKAVKEVAAAHVELDKKAKERFIGNFLQQWDLIEVVKE